MAITTVYTQLLLVWPGGCAPHPRPFSSSNGVEVRIQ